MDYNTILLLTMWVYLSSFRSDAGFMLKRLHIIFLQPMKLRCYALERGIIGTEVVCLSFRPSVCPWRYVMVSGIT